MRCDDDAARPKDRKKGKKSRLLEQCDTPAGGGGDLVPVPYCIKLAVSPKRDYRSCDLGNHMALAGIIN